MTDRQAQSMREWTIEGRTAFPPYQAGAVTGAVAGRATWPADWELSTDHTGVTAWRRKAQGKAQGKAVSGKPAQSTYSVGAWQVSIYTMMRMWCVTVRRNGRVVCKVSVRQAGADAVSAAPPAGAEGADHAE